MEKTYEVAIKNAVYMTVRKYVVNAKSKRAAEKIGLAQFYKCEPQRCQNTWESWKAVAKERN